MVEMETLLTIRFPPPFWVFALVALLIALTNTNNFFAYHAPGAIGASMRSYYHLSTTDLGLMFTMYSFPAVLMSLVSGLAIDRFGVNRASVTFNILILLGAVLIASTPPSPWSLYWLLFGRMLIGFGESLCASTSVMIERWYKGRALTFVTGVNMAFVQLFGSAAAFYVLPQLASVNAAQWLTVGVCAISVAANLCYVCMTRKFTPPNEPSYAEKAQMALEHKPSLLSFLRGEVHFPLLFILVCAEAFFLCPILYTYTAFGPSLLIEKWGITQAQAGSATSVLYVTSLLSPVSGMLIDYTGYRIAWQVVFAAAIPVLMTLLHVTPLSPWLGMGLLGCAFAVTESNTIAMIAEVVPQKQLGFAYGIYSSVISIALIIEPTFVGHLKQSTGSYAASDFLFIGLGILGWLMNVIIAVVDRSGSRILSRSSKYVKAKTIISVHNSYGSIDEAIVTPQGSTLAWGVCPI